jgi:hypothetical protein
MAVRSIRESASQNPNPLEWLDSDDVRFLPSQAFRTAHIIPRGLRGADYSYEDNPFRCEVCSLSLSGFGIDQKVGISIAYLPR